MSEREQKMLDALRFGLTAFGGYLDDQEIRRELAAAALQAMRDAVRIAE